jgi:uncharacterized SAM-binding protein YcdF (DUF218 family)
MASFYDQQIIADAKILWDFHSVKKASASKCDLLLALGSHDLRVAARAADLMLAGAASIMVASGGFGRVTAGVWSRPEGEIFTDIARRAGVPEDVMIAETSAKNTGENITFTRILLQSREIPAETAILVTKPYMKRRALATAQKQWPEVHWYVDSPIVKFEEYPTEDTSLRLLIELMVGDLHRLEVYPDKGHQVPVKIPVDVRDAWRRLMQVGFGRFVGEGL